MLRSVEGNLMLNDGGILRILSQLLYILHRHIPEVVVLLINGNLAIWRHISPARYACLTLLYLGKSLLLDIPLEVEGVPFSSFGA